jgi:transposase
VSTSTWRSLATICSGVCLLLAMLVLLQGSEPIPQGGPLCGARLSSKAATAKAIDYVLKRWTSFARFLEDGRVCLSNNAAERALRGVAVGRKNWTFAGSDAGGRRAAAIYTLVETAKLNGVDPRAWLADVLKRLPAHPAKRLHDLLPWNWSPGQVQQTTV